MISRSGFDSSHDAVVLQLWTKCLHACASVTKQLNCVADKNEVKWKRCGLCISLLLA